MLTASGARRAVMTPVLSHPPASSTAVSMEQEGGGLPSFVAIATGMALGLYTPSPVQVLPPW